MINFKPSKFGLVKQLTFLTVLIFSTTLSAKPPISVTPEIHFGEDGSRPSVEIGAQVYSHNCGLCHGANGKGKGVVAKKFQFYPSTNLLKVKYAVDAKTTHEVIAFGGTDGNVSEYMPPMGSKLSWTELESVVLFVQLIRSDFKQATQLIAKLNKSSIVSRRLGQETYKSRCILCHGKSGEGDGRMAKIIKHPPPFDLTASRQTDEYLKKIITVGGEGVFRSKQMPSWGNELSESEIESIVLYLKSIRD